MNPLLPIHLVDLISWVITIVSITLVIIQTILLFAEKKRMKSAYMAVQGILRFCDKKSQYYGRQFTSADVSEKETVTIDEYRLFTGNVATDFRALMEQIMGVMKSIEPDKDIPFDTWGFTFIKRPKQNEPIEKIEK